ncbi:MAG: hypothetical protein ACXABF_14035 [Candidatus Thorarchaeota archaeon]|jgi:hypothetical protein
MVKKVTILLTILMLQIIPIVYASEPTTIYFTHTHEYYRDFYFVYDSISVEGANFESNRNYNITLVKDITLANNMVIPESSPGTTTMITSDSDGIVTTTEIWSQWNNTESPYLPVGEYYLIVDVDDDGLYTEEIDVVDSTTIRPGRGITREGGSEIPAFQTPEFPGGSIMAILAFLMAALLFRSKKITSLPKIS